MEFLTGGIIGAIIGTFFGAALKPVFVGLWQKFASWLNRKPPE